MLLVGTSHGLEDLESGEKFVDGMAVTALAPNGTDGWYALLDRSVRRPDSTRTWLAWCRPASYPSPTDRAWPCSPTGQS